MTGFRPRSLFGRLALGFVAIAIAAVGLSSVLVLVIVSRDIHEAADAQENEVAASVAGAASEAYRIGGSWSGADLRLAVALGVTHASGLRIADATGRIVVEVPDGGPVGRTVPVSVPVVVGDREVGTVTEYFGLGGRRSALEDVRNALPSVVLASAVLGSLLAAAAALIVSRRMSRPITSMSIVAADIAGGHWDRRVGAATGARELVDLAANLDRMADALVEHEVLRQAMVADVAHELRTPLTVLRASLEAMTNSVTPATPARISALHDDVLRLTRTVEDLEALAAADQTRLSLVRHPVDLGALVARTAQELRPQFEAAGVGLGVEVVRVDVAGDAHRLHQITSNLLSNALKFSESRRPVAVSVERFDGAARLVVRDEGIGIPADELGHVLERFWRGRQSNGVRGSGIGLTVVNELVRAHDGRLLVESTPGVGTTVTVELPLSV
ncbi:MAG: two-component system, OmpR family, sensor histidine kinase BaeS [Actinomycetota bacterium]|jgi:signal transduction histidine kinase|nr:two-component system, OmpR family, sensor histidine kinase BaeS [Actinomycetota bacterium]